MLGRVACNIKYGKCLCITRLYVLDNCMIHLIGWLPVLYDTRFSVDIHWALLSSRKLFVNSCITHAFQARAWETLLHVSNSLENGNSLLLNIQGASPSDNFLFFLFILKAKKKNLKIETNACCCVNFNLFITLVLVQFLGCFYHYVLFSSSAPFVIYVRREREDVNLEGMWKTMIFWKHVTFTTFSEQILNGKLLVLIEILLLKLLFCLSVTNSE